MEQVLILVGVVLVWTAVMAYMVKESQPVLVKSKLTMVLGDY